MNKKNQPVRGTVHEINHLSNLLQELDGDFSRSYTIAFCARKTLMNRTRFNELFKLITGTTFYCYQLDRKMKFALMHLREGNKPVKEIAILCGYKTVQSFSKAFKRYYGVRPSSLRPF